MLSIKNLIVIYGTYVMVMREICKIFRKPTFIYQSTNPTEVINLSFFYDSPVPAYNIFNITIINILIIITEIVYLRYRVRTHCEIKKIVFIMF